MEHSGIELVGSMVKVKVTPAQRAAYHEKLTVMSKYTGDTIKLYEDVAGSIFVPRGLFKVPLPFPRVPRYMNFRGELRPAQFPLTMNIIDHLAEYGGGILKADTGTGKTVICIYILCALGNKPLIIVPTEYLMGQWQERLLQFTDLKQEDIGFIVQNKCQHKKKVVIGMIHSLSKVGKYPLDMYNEFGIVVWDEVHRLAAPTFSETASMFNSDLRFGLSATPRRSDGLENVFKYHIGEVMGVSLTQTITPSVIMKKFDDPRTNHNRFMWSGELNMGGYLNHLVSLQGRNEMIAAFLKRAWEKGRNVLLLSDRIGQLDYLEEVLIKWSVPLTDIGHFRGSRKMGLDRKIILATYGSAGLGADIPRLDTLILATPRADIEQAAGRILRKVTDKSPIIVDIIDSKSSIMVGWSMKRRKFYERRGCTIKDVN